MKKITCIFICLLLICQAFTFTAAADEIFTVTKPTVFISGENEYNIVWVTDSASAAFVELTVDGVSYIYSDEIDGIIRTDDWIHTVRVPKSLLDSAGEYTAITRTVAANDTNGIAYDSETRYTSEFIPYSGSDRVRIGFFSDLHLKPAEFTRLDYAEKILAENIGGADVIVLNGDITDAMPTENYFTETLLEASYRLSDGKLPVVYVRGNHEARGEYAQYLRRYLAFDTGEMYGTFSYGPVSSIVADCGEDKADYRDEYGGMVDFDNYNATQLSWLENMGGYQKGASYNLCISHSPAVIDRMKEPALTAMLEHGTDIAVGGHYHTAQKYSMASFPTLTDGGIMTGGYRAGYMEFDSGKIDFNVFDHKGENVFTYRTEIKKEVAASPQDNTVSAEPTSVTLPPLTEKTSGGMSGASIKGAAVSASVTVGPTVFDAGDNYSIVYMTDAGSNMTKAAVVVEKEGVSYTFTDSQMGNVVSNLLHSVSVPKSVLNGATYQIKTTHLGGYGAYGEKIAYDGLVTELGYTTLSDKYSFPDLSDSKSLCIASFSDMTGGKADAVRVKNSLSVTPDIIVIGGNMAEGLYTNEDVAKNILAFTNTLSEGTAPVILCRGEGESYGDFAPYLSEAVQVRKDGERHGMYYSSTYGDVNFIVLDTAGGKLTDGYMQKQTVWAEGITVAAGTHTFVVAADADIAKTVLGDSYDALGCVDVLGEGGDYGTVTVYEDGKYGSAKNTFAGTGEIKTKKIKATVSDQRTGTTAVPTVTYKSNADKQAAIDADTENEAVVEKYSDTEWYEDTISEWRDRGLDTSKNSTPEFDKMNCAEFLVIYCNLSGVNFDTLEGINTASKAIDWAYGVGVINYKPPIMHEFTAQEIEAILKI